MSFLSYKDVNDDITSFVIIFISSLVGNSSNSTTGIIISSKLIPGNSKISQLINATTTLERSPAILDFVTIRTWLPIDAMANLPIPFSPIIARLGLPGSIGGIDSVLPDNLLSVPRVNQRVSNSSLVIPRPLSLRIRRLSYLKKSISKLSAYAS